MIAVLYRINSQSRAIEDALMREGVAYRIVGGVRFYERKEIKDTLAYLKLVINPFDDVSLRRVINVPSRGIGKGVMDGLETLGPPAELPPLLAAGLEPVVTSDALWVRIERAITEKALAPRALASLTAFRDLIVSLTEMARTDPVSDAVGGARPERLPARPPRRAERGSRGAHPELWSSSRRRANTRRGTRSRRSAVSSISCRCSRRPTRKTGRATRVWLMTLHAVKGLEFRWSS